MRNTFADEVTQLAKADPRVVLLSGDIGNRLFDKLRAQSPSQFFNCGVAEQNMMGVAAGMGLSGLRPIVYTIAPFTTVRCLEQIKVDVAYHQSPVIIVGTGSGLSYSSLGPTHHSLEDFAIFRAIPNLQVLAPWDAPSLRACLRMALESNRPTYIRIGKKGEPDLCEGVTAPAIGDGLTIQSGLEVCILAVGTVAQEARAAGKILDQQGVGTEVLLTHTVKPCPIALFDDLLSRFECFVTVEEHARIGGFGESFLCYIALRGLRKRVICLGTGDSFMPVVGSQAYARSFFGIDATSIAASAQTLVQN
ncbi:MAG: transketolase [Proteobacteria bacterium]|nr:transketolase [Pseudomonadota bacterium]